MPQNDGSVEIVSRATRLIVQTRERLNEQFGIGPNRQRLTEQEFGQELAKYPVEDVAALLRGLGGGQSEPIRD